jgi:hypothetical protein
MRSYIAVSDQGIQAFEYYLSQSLKAGIEKTFSIPNCHGLRILPPPREGVDRIIGDHALEQAGGLPVRTNILLQFLVVDSYSG